MAFLANISILGWLTMFSGLRKTWQHVIPYLQMTRGFYPWDTAWEGQMIKQKVSSNPDPFVYFRKLSSYHLGCHCVYWGKACRTTESSMGTKPEENSLMAQCIAMVPTEKTVLTWHPMGSIQNTPADYKKKSKGEKNPCNRHNWQPCDTEPLVTP